MTRWSASRIKSYLCKYTIFHIRPLPSSSRHTKPFCHNNDNLIKDGNQTYFEICTLFSSLSYLLDFFKHPTDLSIRVFSFDITYESPVFVLFFAGLLIWTIVVKSIVLQLQLQ